eukprot:6255386-Pyramimonas_sp.AAC.1
MNNNVVHVFLEVALRVRTVQCVHRSPRWDCLDITAGLGTPPGDSWGRSLFLDSRILGDSQVARFAVPTNDG